MTFLIRGEFLRVVDVPANTHRILSVQAAFGLPIRSPRQQETILMSDDNIRDDLLEAGILFDQGAAAKRMIGQDVFQAAIEIRGGE